MKTAVLVAIALVLSVDALAWAQSGGTGEQEAAMEQYLYKLKPVPRLIKPEAWTDADNKIVAEHFHRLQELQSQGKLILAGRTLNEDPTAFGIVILEVESEAEARHLMETDPAVVRGIMTAELYPYRVALIRGEASGT